MTTPPSCLLLVEDDENDVFFFRRAVTKAAIALPVCHVRDGQEAIDYLAGRGPFADRAAHPLPRLVLLDLNLPVKHGLDVLRWMRRQPATRSTVVVVLTSSVDILDRHEAYSLGANSYLVKPGDPNDLGRLVAALKLYWLEHNAPPPLPGEDPRLQDFSPPEPA